MALLSITKNSFQLEIHLDPINNGLEFHHFNAVNIITNDRTLYIHFNVDVMYNLFNNRAFLNELCNNNNTLIKPLDLEFEYNLNWTKNQSTFKSNSELDSNSKKYNSKYMYNELLKHFLEEIHNNTGNVTNKCDLVKTTVHFLSIMNYNLNQISQNNLTVLDEFIASDIIINEAEKLLNKPPKRETNFKLQLGHLNDLLSNSTFKYYFNDYKITLAIGIPVYKRTNLYHVYARPILNNGIPYILKTKTMYTIFNDTTPMFYTKQNFNINCDMKQDIYFCKNKQTNSDTCIEDIFYRKNLEKCLTKLPKQNIITKINDSFHFTVVYPMILKTKCNENEFYIKLINNTKIINNECYLENSFFEYNPYKSYENYQIFKPKLNSSTKNYKFCEHEHSNNTEFSKIISQKSREEIQNYNILMTIVCLTIIAAIYTILVGIAFFKYSKTSYEVNTEQNYHDYESIDEYV